MSAQRPTYLEMIKEAISTEPPNKGMSRQNIKKYMKETFGMKSDTKPVKNHIGSAIKKGCEANIFTIPNGLSGKVKLVNKPKSKAKSTANKKGKTQIKKKDTKAVKEDVIEEDEESGAEIDADDEEAEGSIDSDTDLEDVKKNAASAKATGSKKAAPAKSTATSKKTTPKVTKERSKSKSSSTKKVSAVTKASSSKKTATKSKK